MAKPNTVDWPPIRHEYITTHTSYRQLSEKYNVSIAQISRVSNKEHWTEQREQFSHKCFKKAEEKAANMEANRLARLITATTKAIDVAMEAFEDDKQFNRYIVDRKERYGVPLEMEDGTVVDERQWTEERTFDKVDTKALKTNFETHSPDSEITDLSGTSWLFDKQFNPSADKIIGTFSVNFSANGNNYSSIKTKLCWDVTDDGQITDADLKKLLRDLAGGPVDELNNALPAVTSADNGKVLTVVNGKWAAAELPIYNGEVE